MTEGRLGHYRILGRSGRGGAGEVYLAQDLELAWRSLRSPAGLRTNNRLAE